MRVSDGFHETPAVSGRFTAVGSPPLMHILSPGKGKRIPADANLDLAGQAFDDTEHTVKGSKLRWLDGKRVIARGADPSVLGLRPGRHVIRLVATDSRGRIGSTTVGVVVTAVRPALLGFKPPRRLSPTARRLALRVAATVDSTLRSGAKAYRVGRKARTIVLPVRPGRKSLVLRLRLSSGGLASSILVTIPRAGTTNARVAGSLRG